MSILWPRRANPRLSENTAAATPPTLGSSVWTSWRIFSGLDNKTFRSLKIFAVRREFLDRARRNAAVKLIRFGEIFIHQRFRADHAEIGKRAPAENHTIGTDKTII